MATTNKPFGPQEVSQATAIAGERNTSSATTSYIATQQEVNAEVVSLAANSTTIYAGPAFLHGVFVNTIPTTTTVIKDGTTAVFTLTAASLVANTYKDLSGGNPIKFNTSLVVDPDDAETITDMVFFWRPQ